MDFPKINGPAHYFRSRPQKLIAMQNLGLVCQVCRDLRKLVATSLHFVLAIAELRPDVLCRDLFFQLQVN